MMIIIVVRQHKNIKATVRDYNKSIMKDTMKLESLKGLDIHPDILNEALDDPIEFYCSDGNENEGIPDAEHPECNESVFE